LLGNPNRFQLKGQMCFMYIEYMMKRYEVLIAASADKELADMQKILRQRIIEKFDEISEDPRGKDSKKLDEAIYRVRVGDYRIVYNVNDEERKVVVTRIRHRREVYRR
jgi:mRNA interferase RelE/StbE